MKTQLNIHNSLALSGSYFFDDPEEAADIRDALIIIAERLDKARGFPVALNIDVWTGTSSG